MADVGARDMPPKEFPDAAMAARQCALTVVHREQSDNLPEILRQGYAMGRGSAVRPYRKILERRIILKIPTPPTAYENAYSSEKCAVPIVRLLLTC